MCTRGSLLLKCSSPRGRPVRAESNTPIVPRFHRRVAARRQVRPSNPNPELKSPGRTLTQGLVRQIGTVLKQSGWNSSHLSETSSRRVSGPRFRQETERSSRGTPSAPHPSRLPGSGVGGVRYLSVVLLENTNQKILLLFRKSSSRLFISSNNKKGKGTRRVYGQNKTKRQWTHRVHH